MDNLLIKGKFICFEKEFYCLFLIYLDFLNNKEDILVAAGRSSFISTYLVETNPEKLVQIISELINDEEASIEKSKEIRSLFEANMDAIKKSVSQTSHMGDMEKFFSELLKNYIQASVEIAISLEKTDSFKIVDVEKQKEELDQKEKDSEFRYHYKIPSNATIIDCFVVLSPIKGKSIQEINEEDLVLVKIDDSNEKGQDTAIRYGLYTEDKKLKPIIGKVYHKISENKEIVFILELAKNLIGMTREDEAVKVSVIDREKIVSRNELNKNQNRSEEQKILNIETKKEKKKNEFIIYLGVGIFIFILTVIIVLIS